MLVVYGAYMISNLVPVRAGDAIGENDVLKYYFLTIATVRELIYLPFTFFKISIDPEAKS